MDTFNGCNVCIQCGAVKNDIVFGNVHYDYEECYDEPKKVAQIKVPRNVIIYKEMQKYIKIKMSKRLRHIIYQCEDIPRSSKMLALGIILFLKLMELNYMSKVSQMSKRKILSLLDDVTTAIET